ncbi:MAG: hypothetical protein GC200_10810 [Tepidisphaera sp.]|nr:hypothetical protein [Tepidisphaera sp.]
MAKYQTRYPALVEEFIAGSLRLATLPVHLMGLDDARAWAARAANLVPRLRSRLFARAVQNLADAYPQWSPEQVRAGALASYRHFFETAAELVLLPRLISQEGFTQQLTFGQIRPGLAALLGDSPCLLMTGHVGNWEVVGYAISMLGFPMHAVYRPLKLRPLDAWVRDSRARRGLALVSKFDAIDTLPKVLAPGRPVGLVADQTGGDRAEFVPYFGRLTSTQKVIGLLAMQHNATLICGYARRLPAAERAPDTLGMQIEIVDVFGPADWQQHDDPQFYIAARYRRAMERMVRQSPDQHLWMHRVWKARPPHERKQRPFPERLRDKLLSLPWMTPDEVRAIEHQSEQDAANAARFAPD